MNLEDVCGTVFVCRKFGGISALFVLIVSIMVNFFCQLACQPIHMR
jgi:hypothetical protein